MRDVQTLKHQFLEYLEVDRGRSVKTIENYERYLDRFFAFAKVTKVSELTEKQVREFSLYLNHQPGTKIGSRTEPMKRHTQNYYLIALRSFLKFLRQRGIEALSPERIELAKVSERSLDVISAEEIKRLLAAPDQSTIEGKRDRAILELFASTGLRTSELCGLSIDDVDVSQDEFSLRVKDDKTRVVFLLAKTKNALREYLKNRKDLDIALFIRHVRKANDGGELRLSPRAVQRLLKQYAVKAGITRKVTPHVLRHSFAIDLLRNGRDLRSVQAILGHAHIETTQVYTRVTDKHRREVHKKFNE